MVNSDHHLQEKEAVVSENDSGLPAKHQHKAGILQVEGSDL